MTTPTTYPIRLYGDPSLTTPAAPVTTFNDALRAFADGLVRSMYRANGIGLAAPQVGIAKRICVVLESERLQTAQSAPSPSDLHGKSLIEKRRAWQVVREHILINPVVLAASSEQLQPDACLSLPNLYYAQMPRPQTLRIRYDDLQGHAQELTLSHRAAHVAQHELDHLTGVLFLERIPAYNQQPFLAAHQAELNAMRRRALAQQSRLDTLLPTFPSVD